MNTRILAYTISGIAVFLIFAANPHLLSPMVQSQEEDNDGEDGGGEAIPSPTATLVNSKYLTLLGVTFNEADNQVTISGNISNISPDQSFTKAGLANLQPGQQSAFTMTTNIPSEDEVTRYTVLPGGSAG